MGAVKAFLIPVLVLLFIAPAMATCAMGSNEPYVYPEGPGTKDYSGPGEGPGSGESPVYQWNTGQPLTMDEHQDIHPEMAFDSEDNVHITFIRKPDRIMYMMLDPDHDPIVGPIEVGVTDAGIEQYPRIFVDGNDTVHVLFKKVMQNVGCLCYYYEHMTVDQGLVTGAGGFDGPDRDHTDTRAVTMDKDGNFYLYERYLLASSGLGRIFTIEKKDSDGDPAWEREFQTPSGEGGSGQAFHGEWDSVTIAPNGDVITVEGTGDGVISFMRITTDGFLLHESEFEMASYYSYFYGEMDVTVDASEHTHILYALFDLYWERNFIYHLVLDREGGMILHQQLTVEYWDILEDLQVAGPNSDDVMSVHYWADYTYGYGNGGSGDGCQEYPYWEAGTSYRHIIVRTDGALQQDITEFARKCPGSDGVAGHDGTGAFHFITEVRGCHFSGPERPQVEQDGKPVESGLDIVLFSTGSPPERTADLRVVEGTIVIAEGVVQGDPFEVSAVIENIGMFPSRWSSVEMFRTYDGEVLASAELEELWTYENVTVTFNLSLMDEPELGIRVVLTDQTDSNLSNNEVRFRADLVMLPDVCIIEEEVRMTPTVPRIGEVFRFDLPIRNNGDMDATLDVMIKPEFLLPYRVFVPAGATAWLNSTFNALDPGEHTLVVELRDIYPEEVPANLADNSLMFTYTILGKNDPRVEIISPKDGTVLRDRLTLQGLFSDEDGDAVTLQFFVDGWKVSERPTIIGDTFVLVYDLGYKSPGDFEVWVKACDRYACSEDTVTVTMKDTEGTAEIRGVTPEGPVEIFENDTRFFHIDAWASSGADFRYVWYLDGCEQDMTSSGWPFQAPPGSAGEHHVQVSAVSGVHALTYGWDVLVKPLNVPPVVEKPTGKDGPIVFKDGDDEEVTVTVADADGDDIVIEWWLDGKLVKRETVTDGDSSLRISPGDLSDGMHELTAVVDDGHAGSSTSFNVFVPEHKAVEQDAVEAWMLPMGILLFLLVLLAAAFILLVRYAKVLVHHGRIGER